MPTYLNSMQAIRHACIKLLRRVLFLMHDKGEYEGHKKENKQQIHAIDQQLMDIR